MPTENEFGKMRKAQKKTKFSKYHEQKIWLTFQGRINLKVTESNIDTEFNLNIDLL